MVRSSLQLMLKGRKRRQGSSASPHAERYTRSSASSSTKMLYFGILSCFVQKPEEQHQFKEAKSEPLDNRVLRAFGRVLGPYYRVEDGEAALKQLRSSASIRNVSVLSLVYSVSQESVLVFA